MMCLAVSGCATAKQDIKPTVSLDASITIVRKNEKIQKVIFHAPDKATMKIVDGDFEAEHSRQTQSLISRIMSFLTIGAMGVQR